MPSTVVFSGVAPQVKALPQVIITTRSSFANSAYPASSVTTLLCYTTNNPLCGINVTYTNSKGQSQSAAANTGGSAAACDKMFFSQHTNGAGFWETINLFFSPGVNIGYNPTGKNVTLGNATSSVSDCNTVTNACFNAGFGWNPNYDKVACLPAKPNSVIDYWAGVPDIY